MGLVLEYDAGGSGAEVDAESGSDVPGAVVIADCVVYYCEVWYVGW